MNDQNTGGALLGGDFELVSPSPVVGHRSAFEHFVVELGWVIAVGYGGIIHQHDQDFAANVHSLVVVPAILGSYHAVTDKNDVCIESGFLDNPNCPSHEVIAEFHLQIFTAHLYAHYGVLAGGYANEGYFLEIGSVSISRGEADLLELISNVVD